MKRIRYITGLAAALIMALTVVSCDYRGFDRDDAELIVSLYIPDAAMTKAETGLVDPRSDEKTITSLQIWVFLGEDIDSNNRKGKLITYKSIGNSLDETGLAHNTITRFGLPLDDDMFTLLTTEIGSNPHRPVVDVYALANAASAIGTEAKEALEIESAVNKTITESELDAIGITGDFFGTSPLTTSVPAAGLPMSGVMTDAATGSYPVLNISTLTLTRAVSKIRFVFCQQANPSAGGSNLTPFNSNCVIKSISIGGSDCKIATKEYLFMEPGQNTQRLFRIDGYTSLAASISGEENNPLIDNPSLHLAEYPESFVFQSPGHETESAQQYESRIDEEIPAASQYGPIYLRETDMDISGTITYNTGGADKTATFSLWNGKQPEERDIMSRNHSWIVYSYFAEETKTLELKVVVLPWEWSSYKIDYKDNSVNVVRRFTVTETAPPKFAKVETTDGFFNIYFWYKVQDENNNNAWVENILHGDIIIATPVGQTIEAVPVPGVDDPDHQTQIYPYITTGGGDLVYTPVFLVTPLTATIYQNYHNDGPGSSEGKTEYCKIDYTIKCNPHYTQNGAFDTELNGQCIDLHFWVKIGADPNAKYIDLSSESRDSYRFILTPNWQDYLPQNQNP